MGDEAKGGSDEAKMPSEVSTLISQLFREATEDRLRRDERLRDSLVEVRKDGAVVEADQATRVEEEADEEGAAEEGIGAVEEGKGAAEEEKGAAEEKKGAVEEGKGAAEEGKGA